MTNTPDISIIIPCYNSAPYLRSCLNSILTQTVNLHRLQLILVNDASTDSTSDILSEYESSYPHEILVLTLSKNQGQGYARNLALTYASGTYILYVDADDLIAPYSIELLLKHANILQCDILEFDFTRNYNALTNIQTALTVPPSIYNITTPSQHQLFCSCGFKYGTICNKLYLRKFLQDHDIINAEHLVHEDTLFSELSSLYIHRYAYLPVTLYYYRPNSNGTMLQAACNDIHQFDRLEVQLQFLDECDQRNLLKNNFFAIETMFIRTYYIDTLLFVLERFDTPPLDKLQEMQHTILTCFPNYTENPLISYQQTPLENLLLSSLQTPFSNDLFFTLKKQIREL